MSPKLVLNHFSHEHPLHLSNYEETKKPKNPVVSCSGCKLHASGWICSCRICNYILHFECVISANQIHLPFHPNHAFSLQDGIFDCYACSQPGEGFSYSCKSCKIDIHILCAKAPEVLGHKSHSHILELTTLPPSNTKKLTCGICGKYSINHWLYQCNTCHDFDAHVSCATDPLYVFGPCPTLQEEKKDSNSDENDSEHLYKLPNGEKKKYADLTEEDHAALWKGIWANIRRKKQGS